MHAAHLSRTILRVCTFCLFVFVCDSELSGLKMSCTFLGLSTLIDIKILSRQTLALLFSRTILSKLTTLWLLETIIIN